MTQRKELGRIQKATFGYGGYDDAMIGFAVELGGEGWGVGDFIGTWASDPGVHAQWTPADQRRLWADAVVRLRDTLKAAKRKDVAALVGVPIEATFEGNLLKSWRVLTEVL